jgi:hypothetical protein
MRSDRKFLVLFCFLMIIALFPFVGTIRADDVPIGYISYDMYQPGLDSFSIYNFTGDAALPPDFNVVTPLNILNATLVLTGPSASASPISLGTIGPGPLLDDMGNPLLSLQFDSLSTFTSATLMGTLDTTNVLMADNTTSQLNPNIFFTLYPSSGNSLQAGVDFGIIYAGVPVVGVPEPSVFLLILSGFAAFLVFWLVLRAKQNTNSRLRRAPVSTEIG